VDSARWIVDSARGGQSAGTNGPICVRSKKPIVDQTRALVQRAYRGRWGAVVRGAKPPIKSFLHLLILYVQL
jgi:hypothetical protein